MDSIGVGIGMELGRRPGVRSAAAPAPTLRIVPMSATRAYVIAPHPTVGAAALELIHGNQGDTTTPSSSIGAPFGGWRIGGYALLDSVQDDPAHPRETIYSGIGSHDYAMQAHDSGLFGGVYHGGLQNYAQTIPDMMTEAMAASFAQHHSATITWPDGQTAAVTDDFSLTVDGAIQSRVTIDFPHDTFSAYPDLAIVNGGFVQASLDGGGWIDVSAISDNVDLGRPAAVALRNPATGSVVTISDNAPSAANLVNKFLKRVSDGTKLYAQFDTPSQGPLGSLDISRTIRFSATTPDPAPAPSAYVWNGARDGANGITIVQNGTGYSGLGGQLSFTSPNLVFTRGAGTGATGFARVTWAMTGLTAGQAYTVEVVQAVAGSSPSAGTTYGVSASSNGAGATAIGTPQNGTHGYSFTATTATMYLVVNQPWASGTDNVLKIASIGRPVAVG